MIVDTRFAELRYLEDKLARATEVAIVRNDDEVFAPRLRRFRDDHHRHSARLVALFEDNGVPVPVDTAEDFRRHADQHVLSVTEAPDAIEAFRRLLDGERDLRDLYDVDRSGDLPAGGQEVFAEALNDQRAHVDQLIAEIDTEPIRGQGHGGGAYNDSGGPLGTGPGVGGRKR